MRPHRISNISETGVGAGKAIQHDPAGKRSAMSKIPARLTLIALRCCRRGCRRNGSAKSLDWLRAINEAPQNGAEAMPAQAMYLMVDHR
jgi:hypothetical protein